MDQSDAGSSPPVLRRNRFCTEPRKLSPPNPKPPTRSRILGFQGSTVSCPNNLCSKVCPVSADSFASPRDLRIPLRHHPRMPPCCHRPLCVTRRCATTTGVGG
eukprot:8997736-Pyramimonas_sp.AAC.1